MVIKTKYFHASVKQRRWTNQITEICDGEGVVCSTPDTVEKAFISYFQTLFTFDSPMGMDEGLHGMPCTIAREMNIQLMQPLSA